MTKSYAKLSIAVLEKIHAKGWITGYSLNSQKSGFDISWTAQGLESAKKAFSDMNPKAVGLGKTQFAALGLIINQSDPGFIEKRFLK